VNRILIITVVLLVLAVGAAADDLYRVLIDSKTQAEIVRQAGAEPVYRIMGGYLVLTEDEAADFLETSGVEVTFLAPDVSADRLAIDNRPDRANVRRFDLVYEDGDLRIFRLDRTFKSLVSEGENLIPIRNERLEIFYDPPMQFNAGLALGQTPLDSIIDLVSQDSIITYLERLQAFTGVIIQDPDTIITGRLTGTDSNYAARDWIADRFVSFGLDSVVLDSFTGRQLGDGEVPAFNVVGYKTGSRSPGRHIVVGGHFDAVPECPGADDNGSGAVGTMEMARVIAGLEPEITFIFIAFDSEESGLHGARHYAEAAASRGDSIVFMLNMDMIAHVTNDTLARLYYGDLADQPYSLLWHRLADSLAGITGILSGQSGNSDHAPFSQNGFDVTFVHEYIKSTHYHQVSDSTTYVNYDYMTRMVKASLATAFSVNQAPLPILITSVRDGGDGESIRVDWTPADAADVSHYRLYWTTVPATQPDSADIPVDSSGYVVRNLTAGQEYSFYIIAYDYGGRSSIAFERAYATPNILPELPEGLTGFPLVDSVGLTWAANNTELDFDHYRVIRDGALLPDIVLSTAFVDGDPSLGNSFHDYRVIAVDTGGNMSDTTGTDPVPMKAATLAANRILAVNRSASNTLALVNEVVTGEFIREALTGLDYDYFSDTAANNPDRVGLLNMIDYGLVVIGAESGRGQDDIGEMPIAGGILPQIEDYLDLGGNIIIFGRWGGEPSLNYVVDTVFFTPGGYDYAYTNYFNIAFRIRPLSHITTDPVVLESDFIGAHSQNADYPDLQWDSLATRDHTGGSYSAVVGVPFPSLPVHLGSGYTILYTYNSSSDSALTEDHPIAWRYLGNDYKYVYFEMPLSFMERPEAVAALRQAVADMGIVSDVDDDHAGILPQTYTLAQNYPNPFNPRTVIEFYNPHSRHTPVQLEVFNILGQRVKILLDGPAAPGVNRIEWDGCDESDRAVATGIYFYRLKTEDASVTKKMLLLK